MEIIVYGINVNILELSFVIALAVILIWNIVLSFKFKKLSKCYKSIVGGSTALSIEETIIENVGRAEAAGEKVKLMEQKLEDLYVQIEGCIQRVDIIRYNAFSDTGSDLSYSLALLNNKNNGLLLTGIYGRNEAYTYAKPIIAGKSNYSLSEEEISVLNKVKK